MTQSDETQLRWRPIYSSVKVIAMPEITLFDTNLSKFFFSDVRDVVRFNLCLMADRSTPQYVAGHGGPRGLPRLLYRIE